MTDTLPEHADGVHLCVDELLPYRLHTPRWLPPAKSLWSQLLGQHQSKQLGRGMDFAEVRQYQPGDDIRSIDWRVMARTGKPHTKLFTEEREKPTILYIDLSSSMQFGSSLMLKSVQASHVASILSWLAVGEHDRVGAVIDTGVTLIEIKPVSRQKGPLQIIAQLVKGQESALKSIASGSAHSMENGLQALHRLCPKGCDVIVISDFIRYDTSLKPLLGQINRRNRLKFIHIYDPLEVGDTRFRGAEWVSNGKDTRWLNFSALNTRNGIKKAFESHQEKLELLCQSMGIDYRSISSGTPLLKQLAG
ncbi:DUF58 domain-containing protein [Vibrio palustris]|uniref:DUF58 domain-containing protein n=1 Tax=Vibrio palustris TaxID=1918946 RepID=A0A1R4B6B5_9VIBR|nr:DUF58 domain-containing protein [Vibrio palustris]SJL84462.1 hypothetical protein VPAL9027_02446 [Vibrio palustris]